MGFGAEVRKRTETKIGEILAQIQPADLIKFGLIPEFVGRVPVVASLDALDEESLVRILTEPRNALVKQFKKMFSLDDVVLEFQPDALQLIAQEAIREKNRCQGTAVDCGKYLAGYHVRPSLRDDIEKCIITREVVPQGRTDFRQRENEAPRSAM